MYVGITYCFFYRNENVDPPQSSNNDLHLRAENVYEVLPETLVSEKKQTLAFADSADNGTTVVTGYHNSHGGGLPAFDNPIYDTVTSDTNTATVSNGDYESVKGNFKYDKLKEDLFA